MTWALAISAWVSPAASVGIAVWFPFKLRKMSRQRDEEWARRDRERRERLGADIHRRS